MKSKKQIILAVMLGLAALLINKWYLDSTREELTPKVSTYVRAKKAIRSGTTLTGKLFEKYKVPKRYAPKGAIAWKDVENFKGLTLAIDVQPKDYILENYFTTRTVVGNSLSEQVEGEGFRAVSMPVDQTMSLARSIVTGDHIDILFTFSLPGAGQKMSIVLLQDVPVISTGTYSAVEQEIGDRGGRAKGYNSLTLRLSAADAMRLTYARSVGRVSILLRNPQDNNILDLSPISGVLDLLSSTERQKISEIIKKAGQAVAEEERVRKQLRQIMDRQRKQGKS